jgi:hypothetical protein
MTLAQSKKAVLKSLIRERTKWAKAVVSKKGWCAEVVEGPRGPVFVYAMATRRRG